MPRKTSTRLNRDEVRTDAQSPGLVSVARPVDVYVEPTYNPKAGAHEREMAEGLSNLGRAVGSIAQEAMKHETERDFLMGQAKRLRAGELATEEYAKFLEGKPQAYADGFMTQHGRAQAYQASAELDALVKSKGDAIDSDEGFANLTSEYLDKQLEGMQDPHFLDSFLSVFGQSEVRIREQWKADQFAKNRALVRDDFNTSLQNDIANVARGGGSPESVHMALRSYYDQARLMNLPRTEVNELAFEAVRQAAISTSNPEVFDAFKLASRDVDDPTKMIPGLAGSKDWSDRIFNAKLGVERSITVNTAKLNQRDAYYHDLETIQAIKAGDVGRVNQLNVIGLNKGYIKHGTAASKVDAALTQADILAKRHDVKMAFLGGTGWAVTDPEHGKYRKPVFDEIGNGLMADAAGDPAATAEATHRILEMGFDNGMVYSPFKSLMTDTSPSDTAQWQQATAMYERARQISPAQVESLIPKDKSLQYDIYRNAVRAGLTSAEAITEINFTSTPEGLKRAQRTFNENRDANMKAIHKAFVGIGPGVFNDNIRNDPDIRQKVKDLALIRLAHGQSNPDQAVAWALERIKATHQFVQDPDGGDGRMVYNGGRQLPDDFGAAVSELSPKLREQYAGTDYADEGGYYLVPDPRDPTSRDWLIYRQTSGLPIPGKNGRATYNIDELIKQHRAPEIEEIKANQRQHKADVVTPPGRRIRRQLHSPNAN